MIEAVTWVRVGGACALLALATATAGCGSSATDQGSPREAGAGIDDASASDGTMGPTGDASSGDDATSDATAPVDAVAVAVVDAGPPCDPDASADIDCTGLCGPVHDACSGATKMCGGCMPAVTADGGTEARVCDLTTNTCVKPKLTCADLGAE